MTTWGKPPDQGPAQGWRTFWLLAALAVPYRLGTLVLLAIGNSVWTSEIVLAIAAGVHGAIVGRRGYRATFVTAPFVVLLVLTPIQTAVYLLAHYVALSQRIGRSLVPTALRPPRKIDLFEQAVQKQTPTPPRRKSAPTDRSPAAATTASTTGKKPNQKARPAASSPKAWKGAYLGSLNGAPVRARSRGACLVIGPPGRGKSQTVIMPSVVAAPGAVVSTSMKWEVLEATGWARAQRGTLWVLDPTMHDPSVEDHEAMRVRWSPARAVTNWETARATARQWAAPTLARVAGSESKGFYTDAADWLAIYLYAGHLAGQDWRATLKWLRRPSAAVEDVGTELLTEDGIEAEIARDRLAELSSLPDKYLKSVTGCLAELLEIYQSVGAIEMSEKANFDPAKFVASQDTLYICATETTQDMYANLIVTILDQIRLAQYDRHRRTKGADAPLTWVLDEAGNTAQLDLTKLATGAGGNGLHLVVALQDTMQAAAWSKANLLTRFGDKLILHGAQDDDLMRVLSRASGEFDRVVASTTPGSMLRNERTRTSYSTTRTGNLSESDIAGVPEGFGLWFEGNQHALIRLDPFWGSAWSQFREPK